MQIDIKKGFVADVGAWQMPSEERAVEERRRQGVSVPLRMPLLGTSDPESPPEKPGPMEKCQKAKV